MTSVARPFVAALLLLAACAAGNRVRATASTAATARAPIHQPALKQPPAAQTRSAQSDCVREANRRGYHGVGHGQLPAVAATAGRSTCACATSRGQVTLGILFRRNAHRRRQPLRLRLGLRRLERATIACEFVLRIRRHANTASASCRSTGARVLVKRLSDARCVEGQSLGSARRPRLGQQRLPRQVRSHPRRRRWRWRWSERAGLQFGRMAATANARSVRAISAGCCATTATGVAARIPPGARAMASIWVTDGCRGRFERVRGKGGGGNGGGSGGSSAAVAERACVNEVQRRGGRVVQQDDAVADSERLPHAIASAPAERRHAHAGLQLFRTERQGRRAGAVRHLSGFSDGRVPAVAATRPRRRVRQRETNPRRDRATARISTFIGWLLCVVDTTRFAARPGLFVDAIVVSQCPPCTRKPATRSACANSSSMRSASARAMPCRCSVGPVSTSMPRFRTLPAARIPALCCSKRSHRRDSRSCRRRRRRDPHRGCHGSRAAPGKCSSGRAVLRMKRAVTS